MFIKKIPILSTNDSFRKAEDGLEKTNTIFNEISSGEFVSSTLIATQQVVGEY
jgi:hypothetical protein